VNQLGSTKDDDYAASSSYAFFVESLCPKLVFLPVLVMLFCFELYCLVWRLSCAWRRDTLLGLHCN